MRLGNERVDCVHGGLVIAVPPANDDSGLATSVDGLVVAHDTAPVIRRASAWPRMPSANASVPSTRYSSRAASPA